MASWIDGHKPVFFVSVSIIALAALAFFLVLFVLSPTAKPSRKVFLRGAAYVNQLDDTEGDYQIRHSRFGDPGELRHGGTTCMIKSVIQSVPGKIAWPVDLPGGRSRLEFTVGFLCPEENLPGPVDISVSVDTDGDLKTLYERRFWIRFPERRFVYYMEKIPLDDLAGKDVNIVFESEMGGEEIEGVEIVWGDPTIFTEHQTTLPNVVLICLDALRADRTSFLNPDSDLTPCLQRLAEDGVVFKHAVSQSPWTLPSVSTVLTGLYPSFHGAGRRIRLESEQTQDELDDEQKQKGMIIGRSRHILSRLPDSVTGIPEIIGDSYACHMVNGNGVLCAATGVVTKFPSYVDSCWHGRVVVNRAEEWLSANSDKLFFLYTHFMETHDWWKHYKEKYPGDSKYDPQKSREVYDNFVRLGDQYIGQLIDTLKEMDLYDSSLIIFYADHGEHLFDEGWENQHGHGGTLSNILLEVPLIVKFPYSEHAGEENTDYVKLLDIFKTILEEAGCDTSGRQYAEGESLRRVVEGRLGDSRRDTISEFMLFGREAIALQSGNFRAVYYYDNQFFRLVEAASDKRILLKGDAEANAVADRLRRTLASYLKTVQIRKGEVEEAEFSEEEKEGLRNLGYIQ